jgi:hypothetical protein
MGVKIERGERGTSANRITLSEQQIGAEPVPASSISGEDLPAAWHGDGRPVGGPNHRRGAKIE